MHDLLLGKFLFVLLLSGAVAGTDLVSAQEKNDASDLMHWQACGSRCSRHSPRLGMSSGSLQIGCGRARPTSKAFGFDRFGEYVG